MNSLGIFLTLVFIGQISEAFHHSVPLDHFYLRVPEETYSSIQELESLRTGNLFFAEMNKDQIDYQAHYLNGRLAYIELFNGQKMGTMKYVHDVDLGIGFFSESPLEFAQLKEDLKKSITACDFKAYESGPRSWYVCKKERLRVHVFLVDPNQGKRAISRLDMANYVRDKAKSTREPVVNDLDSLSIIIKKSHRPILVGFLTVLGWEKQHDESKWCLANQCIEFSIGDFAKAKTAHFSLSSVFKSGFKGVSGFDVTLSGKKMTVKF